jgi:hypothetical protein
VNPAVLSLLKASVEGLLVDYIVPCNFSLMTVPSNLFPFIINLSFGKIKKLYHAILLDLGSAGDTSHVIMDRNSCTNSRRDRSIAVTENQISSIPFHRMILLYIIL